MRSMDRETRLLDALQPHERERFVERFMAQVHHEPNTGCWLWGGGEMRDGYGCTSISRVTVTAHRVALALDGRQVPAGMFACHRCDVRWCVNPEHLYIGTHRDNTADMVRRGRAAKGERQGSAVLTEDAVREMRKLWKTGVPSHEIGRRFGVSRSQAYTVVSGRDWKHVRDEC